MKQTLNRLLQLSMVALLAASCKKDDVQLPPTPKTPYLVSTVQATSYGRDSFAYTYTGNIITGMDYYFGTTKGGFYKYIYTPDSSVAWWSWNTLPNEPQYSYTLIKSGNKINSITWKTNGSSFDIIAYKALFKYNGSKLDSVFVTEDYQGIFKLDTTWVYKITYTGDDITDIKTKDLTNGAAGSYYRSASYTYDNTPNAFALVNKNYWMLGYNYKNTETFDVTDVVASLSAHNITSETTGGSTKNYTYTKDSLGNVIASSGGGKLNLAYRK